MRNVSPPGVRPRRADRQPADLLRGGDVAIQKRRRKIADRHIVKAMTRIVLRQQRRRIDVQRQQIANGILVFRPIEPPKRFGPAGIRILRRRAVERGGQPGHDLIVGLVRRPLLANRAASAARAVFG